MCLHVTWCFTNERTRAFECLSLKCTCLFVCHYMSPYMLVNKVSPKNKVATYSPIGLVLLSNCNWARDNPNKQNHPDLLQWVYNKTSDCGPSKIGTSLQRHISRSQIIGFPIYLVSWLFDQQCYQWLTYVTLLIIVTVEPLGGTSVTSIQVGLWSFSSYCCSHICMCLQLHLKGHREIHNIHADSIVENIYHQSCNLADRFFYSLVANLVIGNGTGCQCEIGGYIHALESWNYPSLWMHGLLCTSCGHATCCKHLALKWYEHLLNPTNT